MKNIEDLCIKNKRVLIRVDYNVPINNGKILDDFRIRSSIPTIKHCIKNGASIILLSHLGRPNKKKSNKDFSLRPICIKLEELLGIDVKFSNDCISDKAIKYSKNMIPGQIHLLENLRFYNYEIENDITFSSKLAKHGDVYINDAFATAHRKHASNAGILKFINFATVGLLMKNELKYLDSILKNPKKPCIALLGGVKVIDKISFIENIMLIADTILIGGAMAFTFLKAQNINIGATVVDPEALLIAQKILKLAKDCNINIILPADVIASISINIKHSWRITKIKDMNYNEFGFDIGPETVKIYKKYIFNNETIIWNGPLGVSEISTFSNGTRIIAKAIQRQTKLGSISIIGGGDTASAIKKIGIKNGFSHISTGGGASLQLMSGKKLPALEALRYYE